MHMNWNLLDRFRGVCHFFSFAKTLNRISFAKLCCDCKWNRRYPIIQLARTERTVEMPTIFFFSFRGFSSFQLRNFPLLFLRSTRLKGFACQLKVIHFFSLARCRVGEKVDKCVSTCRRASAQQRQITKTKLFPLF